MQIIKDRSWQGTAGWMINVEHVLLLPRILVFFVGFVFFFPGGGGGTTAVQTLVTAVDENKEEMWEIVWKGSRCGDRPMLIFCLDYLWARLFCFLALFLYTYDLFPLFLLVSVPFSCTPLSLFLTIYFFPCVIRVLSRCRIPFGLFVFNFIFSCFICFVVFSYPVRWTSFANLDLFAIIYEMFFCLTKPVIV